MLDSFKSFGEFGGLWLLSMLVGYIATLMIACMLTGFKKVDALAWPGKNQWLVWIIIVASALGSYLYVFGSLNLPHISN